MRGSLSKLQARLRVVRRNDFVSLLRPKWLVFTLLDAFASNRALQASLRATFTTTRATYWYGPRAWCRRARTDFLSDLGVR